MPDQKAKKTSKRPRRDPHSGRSRGSTIKTGNRGARRTELDVVQRVLLGKGMYRNFRLVSRR